MPGGRTGNRYVPVSAVTTEGVPATPAPRSVTVTPGSTLPDSSTILPIISPVVRCAAADAARPNASSRTAHRHFITPPTFLLPARGTNDVRMYRDRVVPEDRRQDTRTV